MMMLPTYKSEQSSLQQSDKGKSMTEQIDLLALRQLIDQAHELQRQLGLTREQLDKVSAERDVLQSRLQQKDEAYLREKAQLNAQHKTTVVSLKQSNNDSIASLKSAHQAELTTLRDELTKKNANLLKEMQKTQKSNQAMFNRIRGITS